MTIIKSKRLKERFVLTRSNFTIQGLIKLKEEIEEVLEKESQRMMIDNATVTVSEKGMKKIRKMCEL